MKTEPIDRIRAEIRASGPLTFARFMQIALYDEGGYYEHPPVGAQGDFVTSPHVHPVFATMLGEAIRQLHRDLQEPDPFRLVEAGAGDGTLARDLLVALRDLPLEYRAVDVSPGARAALAGVEGLAEIRAEIPSDLDVLIANELLDNLPFRVVRDGQEIGIGLDADDDPCEVSLEADPSLPARGPDAVVPTGGLAFVDLLASSLGAGPGYALLIDYGTDGEDAGPVHGYASHAVVEDVLREPGRTDITAGVDFAALRERAAALGLTAFPTVSQRDALVALGFEAWFAEQLAIQHEQLASRAGLEAVQTWSSKSRASLLADPGGLGRFRWLLLASPGLPEPGWLRDARVASRRDGRGTSTTSR